MQIFAEAQGCYSFHSRHATEIWNDIDKLKLFDFPSTRSEASRWQARGVGMFENEIYFIFVFLIFFFIMSSLSHLTSFFSGVFVTRSSFWCDEKHFLFSSEIQEASVEVFHHFSSFPFALTWLFELEFVELDVCVFNVINDVDAWVRQPIFLQLNSEEALKIHADNLLCYSEFVANRAEKTK